MGVDPGQAIGVEQELCASDGNIGEHRVWPGDGKEPAGVLVPGLLKIPGDLDLFPFESFGLVYGAHHYLRVPLWHGCLDRSDHCGGTVSGDHADRDGQVGPPRIVLGVFLPRLANPRRRLVRGGRPVGRS